MYDTDFDAYLPEFDRTDDDCFEVERDEDFDADYDDADYDDADPGEMDGDHESALESVYGPEDSYLDASWEDQYDGGDF